MQDSTRNVGAALGDLRWLWFDSAIPSIQHCTKGLVLMRLLLMGPPGAGKGTQASAIAARYRIPGISTGDIFRAHAADGTALGLEARRYMEAGDYVPDEVTNAMVADRLSHPDCRDGFLLDGYPRTLLQVETLDAMLDRAGAALDAVVLLSVNLEELVQRLLARAGSEGRADDTEEVIRRRQEVYAEQTAPLVAEYAERGLLETVSGVGSVGSVAARVSDALERRQSREVSRRSVTSLGAVEEDGPESSPPLCTEVKGVIVRKRALVRRGLPSERGQREGNL